MVKRTIFIVVRLALGCILVVLGIVGLIMPIVPGWILLIPGLALLSREMFSVCRQSRIRIVRESACRLSDGINRSFIGRYLELLRKKSKRATGKAE